MEWRNGLFTGTVQEMIEYLQAFDKNAEFAVNGEFAMYVNNNNVIDEYDQSIFYPAK